MANRFLTPAVQFVDYNGRPLAFGRVFFYYSKTSTPLDTYSNQALSIINPNPITLDAFGRAGSIFLGALPYKVVLENSQGDQVWTEDPVTRQQSSITGAGGNLTGVINFAMGASVDAGSVGPTPPIYLLPGTTFWIVPPGVTLLAKSECWGAGASQTFGFAGPGASGAYASRSNISVTPGDVIAVNVASHLDNVAAPGPSTWFISNSIISGNGVVAANGFGNSGGSAADCYGDTIFGGAVVTGPAASAGGSGAPGPNGAGQPGGDGGSGAGGGGGNGGGTAGSSSSAGAHGGKNYLGQAGGAPSTNASFPGAGGGGVVDGTPGDNRGGNGADDPDNGGGGGGGSNGFGVAGNGGFPGGGAGGFQHNGASLNGVGGDGQIKITKA